MPILPSGGIFEPGPVVSGSKVRGSKTWRYCPYSTQSTDLRQDTRVPEVEKVYHQETNGRMHTYSLGRGLGWVCADNGCSFYTGTATTEVDQAGRVFTPASGTTACPEDLPTLSGSVAHLTRGRTIVSGTRYFQI
ncbi:MAG: hypothetical protein GF334_03355 [Candidatus Altiarchaeales archaeon]|nr:hypothetical protein [Candidatus Altiarchaeales archaeon]